MSAGEGKGAKTFEEFDRMLSQQMGLQESPRVFQTDAFDRDFREAELAVQAQKDAPGDKDERGAGTASQGARRSLFQRNRRNSGSGAEKTGGEFEQQPAPSVASAALTEADAPAPVTAPEDTAAKPPKPRAVSKPRRIKKAPTKVAAAEKSAAEGDAALTVLPEPDPEPELKLELSPREAWRGVQSDPVFGELTDLMGKVGQKLGAQPSLPQQQAGVGSHAAGEAGLAAVAQTGQTAQHDSDDDSPSTFLKSRRRAAAKRAADKWVGAIPSRSPSPSTDALRKPRDMAKSANAVDGDEPLFTSAPRHEQQQRRRWQKSAGPRLEPKEDAVLLVTLVQCFGLTFPPCEEELEDIYVTLQFGTQPMERSTTKFLLHEPVYRETFRFLVTAHVTVDAEAVLDIDVRGCSSSGIDLSIGEATLDLCEVFASASGEEVTGWSGQTFEREWPITRLVDGDPTTSGKVRLAVKAMGIGPPSGHPTTAAPSPVATGSGHDIQEESAADLLALANAFEASTLGLDTSTRKGVQPEEGSAKAQRVASDRKRSKSAQRVRIDESMNKIDTPRGPPASRRAQSASRSSGRLSSPQRAMGAGARKKPPTPAARFHAGGHAVLATNTKYMTSDLSPRKGRGQPRRVDPTTVGDRLSSQRPKRHFEEAAHVLAGEHARQWTNRLGSPTRQARVQSPDRGRSGLGSGSAKSRAASFDADKLRQELRELKLMALHDRAKRSKVSSGEIDKALEGDRPKASLVECILQVEAEKAGMPLTPSSARKKKSSKGVPSTTIAAKRLGSPVSARSSAQQRLGSPSFGATSPTGRASNALRSPPRQLRAKEAAKAAAVARRLSSPTRSSDRRNMETMNHHTVRRLNSPDRPGRLSSPTRASRVASPEPVRAAAELEAKRRDAITARRVAARRMGSPPSRRTGLTSPDRRARPGRQVSPEPGPWSDVDESYGVPESMSPALSDASAKWKKAATAAGQGAVMVKRMTPGRISEAEASKLIAGLTSGQDEDGNGHTTPAIIKCARALVMTARANRANVDLLVSMGAVEPIVDLLSSKSSEAQECACLALVALSETDEGCTVAAELGALPRLLSMSSSPTGVYDKRVIHSATAALSALARVSANGEEIAELRVTELLSALCTNLEGDAQSRATAETALQLVRLCREGLGYQESGTQGSSVRRAVGDLGGISLLVSLLGSTSAPVQLAALDGLKELCKLDDNRVKILETDGVELLVSLSEAGCSSAVQRRAKTTLDVFCESAICRERVGELQVRSMVLELRLPGHSETLGPTLRGLSALCRESQANRLAAIKANALLDAVRLLTSPSASLQRAAVDLLKELAREQGAAETAGELGAVEPLMSLQSAATAKNDSGMQRATSKCLQLLQRAAPNKERLARLRVSTLVGKLKLAEEQGLSQHPDDGLMDAEALCDHAKSITQLCKDDHSNVARFGELGALPRLIALLRSGHGPTIARALSSALRELGWDEENRLEIAELKMTPMVSKLQELISKLHGGEHSAAGLDVAEIAAVVTAICDECTDDDNNRKALSTCGGLEPLVELTLSDVGGAARTALNTAMKELARNSDLKERIMQLLLDARSRAAEPDAAPAHSTDGTSSAYSSSLASDPQELPQVHVPTQISTSSRPTSSSIDRGPLQGLTIDSTTTAAGAGTVFADLNSTHLSRDHQQDRDGGAGDGSLRQREKNALQERLREVEEDLSGAHRRRVELEQQSAMLRERNRTLEMEARAREAEALARAQSDAKIELERTQVEIKVKDKVLEQQQREIQALKDKLTKRNSRSRPGDTEGSSEELSTTPTAAI